MPRFCALLLLLFAASVFCDEKSRAIPYAPSTEALEMIGAQFIDALIKKGQIEMAKNAFKTQLEVLEKVQPDQFEKYKKLKVEDLAADAVMQQAELAKLQPKTGNAFIDMLNSNGIPIGSSIRGLEDAIRTQRDMEINDPSEQIAKAVLEKFQTQILPGLVANMIAGRNPFKMPQQQMRRSQMQMQRVPAKMMRQSALDANRMDVEASDDDGDEALTDDESRRDLTRRLRASPRLRALLENPEVANLLSNRRMRDSPLHSRRPLATSDDDDETFRAMKARAKLDQKSQIVLGLHGLTDDDYDDDDEKEAEDNALRRAPPVLSSAFLEQLKSNDELKAALNRIKYRVEDVEKYLEPRKVPVNPNPQPGFFVPRKIPTKPRKMVPLLIGADPKEVEEVRRHPSAEWELKHKSRVITNLKNNPSLAALFMDDHLEKTLSGREMLSADQKGQMRVKTIKALPRLYGETTSKASMIDAKVTQMIEERPVPPLFWEPKGRHTRFRWTGANEKEIPGLGTRFILPSLDPTMPAVNSGFSTQGRARDEWDTMFKIPNNWNPGDEIGFTINSNSKRFVGGNGAFDMPALHL
ncbi:unnamed protein product [Caenorhabditis bovis]|uniref:Uncharacterized protein n=1 Tax=Caenorhabditis bovis TaxID=2654633 RepID=A0A8S1EYK3_9PELO|nr:unnamed protein product [Caenorhabditis bovis]